MKILSTKWAVMVAILLGAWAAWNLAYPSATWRYRMTVTVETPEGLKTGSAVREVHASREPHPLPEMHGFNVAVKGEAVTVDLGKRGVLFALIRGGRSGEDYGYYVVFDAFPYPPGGGQLTSAGINYYSHLKAGPADLPPDSYPRFVHFKDLQDPLTVEDISPTNTEDKPSYAPTETIRTFGSAFGEGVRLKSVAIEMTRDPVTGGVDKWLPWLSGRDYLNGQRSGGGPELSSILNTGDFKKGAK